MAGVTRKSRGASSSIISFIYMNQEESSGYAYYLFSLYKIGFLLAKALVSIVFNIFFYH